MTTEKIKRFRDDFLDANGIVVPDENHNAILGLFGKYRALSNFHEAPVQVDGYIYQTSEAAYMAQKTDVELEKIALTQIQKGKDAKRFGQTVTLRSNWDQVKLVAMEKVLMAKFEQNVELRELLLSTGNKYIEETNWWGDRYWGVWGGEGLNKLGEILMRVRQRLWNRYHGTSEFN